MTTASTVQEPASTAQWTQGLRVLVVEDEADSAVSLATLLGVNGHDVQVAQDGPTALQEAQAAAPDVVLLDIGLPGGMDGYEVARRLQQQRMEKKPLLVAVTGRCSEMDRRHGEEVGIDLHLVKPADVGDLLWLLKRFQRVIAG